MNEEEIIEVLSQLPSDKASGLFDFQPMFFKTFWLVVKTEVLAAIHEVFKNWSICLMNGNLFMLFWSLRKRIPLKLKTITQLAYATPYTSWWQRFW